MSGEKQRIDRAARGRAPTHAPPRPVREPDAPHLRRPVTARPAATAARPPDTAPAMANPGAGATRVSFALGSGWMLIPLRLFLGVTFVYAGLQKLTDPQFFKPTAARFIGHQIQSFAHGSPISGVLLHVALPHAVFFGALIAWGEIAIGLGALVGFLARPAAAFGLLLSVIFFLSASWRVYPYFYGADIVFAFGWLALGLAPHAGLPSLDAVLARRLEQRGAVPARVWRLLAPVAFSIPEGWPGVVAERSEVIASAAARPAASGTRTSSHSHSHSHRRGVAHAQRASRRSFLLGTVSGVLGALGAAWLWNSLNPAPSNPSPANATPAAGSGSTGGAIARASDVPVNSATSFTIPTTGDPGVIVHLADGRFVAYDATCTHAGCPVDYDPGSKALYCPCHGAVFDPANQAAVLEGPAPTPLTPVAISVQSSGDIVMTG
jgi:thiosulfate dehydrogenase [quinone] large subunit